MVACGLPAQLLRGTGRDAQRSAAPRATDEQVGLAEADREEADLRDEAATEVMDG
jgi:hypothetical protein